MTFKLSNITHTSRRFRRKVRRCLHFLHACRLLTTISGRSQTAPPLLFFPSARREGQSAVSSCASLFTTFLVPSGLAEISQTRLRRRQSREFNPIFRTYGCGARGNPATLCPPVSHTTFIWRAAMNHRVS